ncbi:MAG: hypothetical protein E7595_06945 [Ruminococcaceae bacterium]|nr:hypothetical protein [Oscillospiraceae bacterium]
MKKLLAIVLSLLMLASVIPLTAVAIEAEILNQPKLDDPTFNVSHPEEVEKYQWYVTTLEEIVITDENASNVCTNCEGNYSSVYDSENDLWTGEKMCDAENGYEVFYFCIELKADDSLYVDAGPEVSDMLLYDYNNTVGLSPSFSMVGNVQVFVADTDGTYCLSVITPSLDSKISAFMVNINQNVVLETETTETLRGEIECGYIYNCVATYNDGTELKSNSLPAFPKAYLQPTPSCPEFGVLFEHRASFQWYEIDTDGNATALAGENSKILSNLELGKSYYCEASFPYGMNLISEEVSLLPEIISQPTAADPTFEVTFEEKAGFQWYEATPESIIIDDTMVEEGYVGTYDPETQEWTPYYSDPYEYSGYMEYYADFFYLYLNKGDTVRITPSNPDAISPADPDFRVIGEDESYNIEIKDGVYEVTVEESDTYEFYQYGISPETSTYKIELLTYSYKELEGETEKTLQNAEHGKLYQVDALYENSFLSSDVFEMEYTITKQPTAEDPSVEVNFPDDVACYEWLEVVDTEIEVTDENAEITYYEDESDTKGYYDAENDCWIPSLYATHDDPLGSYYEYDLFHLELKKGDTLVIIPSAELKYNNFNTWNDTISEDYTENWVETEGIYSLEITEDGEYWFYFFTYHEDITFKAYIVVESVNGVVEGETEAKLGAAEKDKSYICEVTFKDGTVLVTDSFVYDIEYILGDINSDGAINQYDYILVKRHYFGTRYLTDNEMLPADVNKDGAVNQYDYILIKRHYFGTYVIG